jgi:peptidoglycan-N-acetylglucosamine deacetylase
MSPDQQQQAALQDRVPLVSRKTLETGAQREFGTKEQASPNWMRQAMRWGMARTLLARWFLTNGPSHGHSVCLTFDDGPDPILTPPLLDVLRDCAVRATFFVVGKQVERYPGIVQRMAAEGHCVGNHSFNHDDPAKTSARQLVDEARRTATLLAGLLGHEVRLFRPPYGSLTVAKLWRLWLARQTIVLWSVDPKDYARHDAAEVRDWFSTRPLRAGDIVLFHDTIPHAKAVLPALIDDARARGLTFTTPLAWQK